MHQLHRVLPKGKNSDLNFDFIAYFQALVPKKTLYHNEIIISHHFEPLLPANLKISKLHSPHFTLMQ